jgi:ribosome biogenesis protein BRX1
MGKKRSRKSVAEEEEEDEKPIVLKPERSSDEPPLKKLKWINKTRVLVFSSRGITFRARHLMTDLKNMMPHAKADSKMDRKDQVSVINEICEMKNCNKVLYFEMKKKQDLYLWLANSPKGPCAKFLVENVHTMMELKMTGNCLKASRPILSFDKSFDDHPHYSVMKELFIQIFGTPRNHPKSQPFIDHILSLHVADNRIWFRNFQVLKGVKN